MTEAERIFYEWWHANREDLRHMPIDWAMRVFLAGWRASEEAAVRQVSSE